MRPAILGVRPIYAGYLKIERLRVRLADGSQADREVESHGDAVAVLPYDPQRRCALTVRLFRAPLMHAAGLDSLEEACAGMIDAGESGEAAVRREAGEELGVQLRALEEVGRVWTSPGISTERVTLFIAEYDARDRSGPGGGVAAEHELITPAERALQEFADAADRGAITDIKLLTLVLALRLRRPKLFDLPIGWSKS